MATPFRGKSTFDKITNKTGSRIDKTSLKTNKKETHMKNEGILKRSTNVIRLLPVEIRAPWWTQRLMSKKEKPHVIFQRRTKSLRIVL